MRTKPIRNASVWAALAAAALFITVTVQAQEPAQDAFLDSLVGTWSGSDEMGGHPISHTFSWSWQMNHQFLFGDHSGTVTVDGEDQTVQVHFYLHPNGDGTYTGVSISSEGVVRDLSAHLTSEGAFVSDDTRDDGTIRRLRVEVTGETLTMTFLAGDASGTFTELASTTLTRQ